MEARSVAAQKAALDAQLESLRDDNFVMRQRLAALPAAADGADGDAGGSAAAAAAGSHATELELVDATAELKKAQVCRATYNERIPSRNTNTQCIRRGCAVRCTCPTACLPCRGVGGGGRPAKATHDRSSGAAVQASVEFQRTFSSHYCDPAHKSGPLFTAAAPRCGRAYFQQRHSDHKTPVLARGAGERTSNERI